MIGFFDIIEMVFSKAEEVDRYENDIPAKKKTQSKSAWFQKKNEDSRRKKSISCKKIKRKKKIDSLGHRIVVFSSIYREILNFKESEWIYEVFRIAEKQCGFSSSI